MEGFELISQGSIFQIADAHDIKTKSLVQAAQNEEALGIGFEKILAPALASIGIKLAPKSERLGADAKTIYRGILMRFMVRSLLNMNHPMPFLPPDYNKMDKTCH